MRYLLKASGIATAIAFAVLGSAALAQESSKVMCQAVGANGVPEPLGDREGHGISVMTETCRVKGGAISGGIVTGQSIWEWDKTNANMLSVSGVVRKPGAFATYELMDGKLALTIIDGKATGFTASGKGRWPLATGSAASMAGKTFTYKTMSTGPGEWETDVIADVGAERPQSVRTTQEPALEPVVPAGYQKIAPASVDTSRQMLAQTSTIFRGSLKDVQFTYDGCSGPRTNYVFSNSSPLFGEKVEAQVNVRVLGGPTPRGTWLTVSELPQLALNSQYVVFLRNTDWTLSPIVGNLVFRVEAIDGREVLVNPDGRAVTGWDDNGPLLSAGMVSEGVGNRRHGYGYRGAQARDHGEKEASGALDPKVELTRDPKVELDSPRRFGSGSTCDPRATSGFKAGVGSFRCRDSKGWRL